ncbi:phosphatidylinositol-specific phospholipase C [Kitasatospora sp. NPDC057940]|uniref:phosphatidylinositol-specific phospholipase C n=1 Tax=Kitasatospora sp. NPDC057940 TaxID=3346285 RepID=UPI0036DB1812
MSPTRRDVLRWGAGAGGALLAAAAFSPDAAAAAAAPAAAAVSPSVWMSALDDATPLTALTIPGSHDSCCTDPLHGTEWSHTQNWGLPEQLQRGIRFLDIRCNGLAGTADELGIYHSDNYQYVRLQDVLDQCRAFLAANPGEGLVMRVRNEYAGGNRLDDAEFQRRINHYLDGLGYRSLFWTNPWWPTLGQARGRVVLAADFANPWSVIQWSSATNTWFATQDTFQGISLAAKSKAVTDWFDRAFLDQGSARMYVNFTSYANGGWPKVNAAAIMPPVRDYLNARRQQPAHFGIVPMDFPDFHTDVLQLLIDKNFIGR